MNKQKFIYAIFSGIILILINIVCHYYFHRFDLTSEKKYSISKTTKDLIEKIDDIIYFKIYLHGDIPIQYKKLENELKFLLNEFRVHSNLIEFDFIDPSEMENEQYKLQLQKELFEKGIKPIPHRDYQNNKMEETWVFPGLTALYKTKEINTSVISSSFINNQQKMIQKSIEDLEYLLVSIIRQLTFKKEKIGLLTGHGETVDDLIHSFKNDISENYEIITLSHINGRLNALDNLDCIIINNPTSKFDEKDKFIIDQFVMHGGKSMWILNGTNANMDSLENQNKAIALAIENRNLNDMLFTYGIRINSDIIQDLQSATIPIVTHYIEEKPQWTFFRWPFFPVVRPNQNHQITQNINPVKTAFPSSIDLMKNIINKTVLLSTSHKSNKLSTPAFIDLSTLKNTPDENLFNTKSHNIAVLLEGEFQSVFKNRVPLEIKKNKQINFKSSCNSINKMIIISDPNLIKNQFLKGQALPLGLDKHTGKQYGNKNFILNSIDYLLNNNSFIDIRSKNIQLRLLNQQKISTEKRFWQWLNMLIPLTLIIIYAYALAFIRKKKYAK